MLKYIAKALIIHRNELETYMLEPIEHADVENANFDILAWWKMKSGKYPILARMSRDILAVPISTVASEAAFSVGGRTLSAVRNSLNDESLEALICLYIIVNFNISSVPGVISARKLLAYLLYSFPVVIS